jgi:hypothetical protein
MVDPKAAEFFQEQMTDPENLVCCDTGEEGASWASVSYGIYLSIGAAGLHRSLGVKVSFVQSTTMDSWRPVHLRMMELGGNRRFHDFLREHGVPENMPTREKYSTRAAEWYRKQLKAFAEETELPEPLPPGTGHLPSNNYSNSAQVILDKVFATVPESGAMTNGGVVRKGHGPQSRKISHAKGMEESSVEVAEYGTEPKRSRTMPVTCTATLYRKPSASFNVLQSILPVDKLFGHTRCPNADRLKTLSSGKMEGFGSDGLPNLLPKQSSARGDGLGTKACQSKCPKEALGITAMRAVAAAA